MKRHIFAFDTPESACFAVEQLKARGIDESQILAIARSDIQREKIPDKLLDASTDFVPALGRGAVIGAMTGLCAGIVAGVVPAFGVGIAGSELIAFVVGGALLGAWSSALIGSTVPDAVRRTFEKEIEASHTLLIIETHSSDDVDAMHSMSLRPSSHLIWQSDSRRANAA